MRREQIWFIVLSVAQRILMMPKYVPSVERLYTLEPLRLEDMSATNLRKSVSEYPEAAR